MPVTWHHTLIAINSTLKVPTSPARLLLCLLEYLDMMRRRIQFFVFYSQGFQPLQLLRIQTLAPTTNSSKMPSSLKSAGVGNASILSLLFSGMFG